MAKQILFVDDEADWLFMVASYFKDFGLETLTARTGKEAFRITSGVPLDVIIIDVNLAGENGVHLMEFFKTNHPGVPIILYTGMVHDQEAIDGMLAQGAYQYLRKGTLNDLLEAVQKAAIAKAKGIADKPAE